MADMGQLEIALRNADAAGDVNAARALAGEITHMRSSQQAPAYSGSILPFSKDSQGHVSFDSNAGVLGAVKGALGMAKGAVTLPGDVYSGKTPITGEDGQTNPEVINRSADLAALVTPVNPAIRVGDKAIPGVKMALRPAKKAIPTTEQLASAGAADINAAKNSGLEVTASSVGEMSRKIQSELFDKGIHPVDAPNTFVKLKELENAPAGSFATAANLQSLRESLGHTAQNFNPNAAKDQLAASRAIRGLDEFIPSVGSQDVLAGTPSATSDLFQKGRANYAAAMRSNDLTGALDRANTGILERAQVRAQAANSGRNLDNTIRSKVASLLEKPKEVSGFSDPEIAALNKVVAGGPGRNAARNIGNVLGGGGGLGQMLTASIGGGTGAMLGGPVGAVIGAGIPAAGGVSAKYIANLLAKRSLKNVDELIRMRSPLYQNAPKQMAAISPEKRAALGRLLLMMTGEGQQPYQNQQ